MHFCGNRSRASSFLSIVHVVYTMHDGWYIRGIPPIGNFFFVKKLFTDDKVGYGGTAKTKFREKCNQTILIVGLDSEW